MRLWNFDRPPIPDPVHNRLICSGEGDDDAGGGGGDDKSEGDDDTGGGGDDKSEGDDKKKTAAAEAAKKARERERAKNRKTFLTELGCDSEEEYEALKAEQVKKKDQKKNSGKDETAQERAKREAAETETAEVKRQLALERVERKVEKAAHAAGCIDSEVAAMLYIKHLGETDEDDDDRLDVDDFLADLAKNRPKLFESSDDKKNDRASTGTKDKDPDNKNKNKKPAPKRVQDMTPTEKQAHFRLIRSGG